VTPLATDPISALLIRHSHSLTVDSREVHCRVPAQQLLGRLSMRDSLGPAARPAGHRVAVHTTAG
jgi:hypothetical protein